MGSSSKTLDEFAMPEEVQGMVTQHRPRIEQLFRVELNVLGVLRSAESPSRDLQGERKIWLQLQGRRENLQRAKEYIKGLCAPEMNEEVYYPKDMQCIFLGAHGLFLDCLIQGTSAHLTFLRPGTLAISGLAEAFVMAQSRIQEFVEKHQKNPKLPEEREAQVKRDFRELVEAHDDKHAMDLLILPTSVKEELLSLVKEAQDEIQEQSQRSGCWGPQGFGQGCSLEWETVTVGGGRPQSPTGVQMAEAGLSQKEDLVLPPKEPGGGELGQSGDEKDYLRELIKEAMANCGHSPSEIPTEIPTDAPLEGLLRRLNERGEHQAEGQGATGPPVARTERGRQFVTGAQRFEEALQTQFKLNLANTPGKKNLRMVIIDGSNVAMMHGLNQFFSCRGIALAVQYFWDRGHREVTVLVPAYRMEEDSNVRERHFLAELQDLSILSVTPSRKIDGKGIVPYDDRIMLRLAEQTNGVIVTNDQFRDLAKESKKWIRVIKER
uniref:RNase NYN domain-containing protein n=1 Tax=Varanus komodoensis TaxID=61221 RepID=A0A8D2IU10_VARKO